MSYRSRVYVVVAIAASAARDASLGANRADKGSHTSSGTGNDRLENMENTQVANFNRIFLDKWVSECPLGQSPKTLNKCLKALDSIDERVDESTQVTGDMIEKDFTPSGCSITGEKVRSVYYNPFDSDFQSAFWQVVCSVNLKPDAQAVRNTINQARSKKVCASAILSTTASKRAQFDSDETASSRAKKNGYTFKKKFPVIEITTAVEKGSDAAPVIDDLIEELKTNEAFENKAYKDVGFAWFPRTTRDVYVLTLGAPRMQNSNDVRACRR